MTATEKLEKRVSALEGLFQELIFAQFKTEESIFRLSKEMRAFKDEMRAFKDEMSKLVKDLNKKWGDLANKMGTLVEDLIIPNLPLALKKYFNLDEPDDIIEKYKRKIKSKNLMKEFDAIFIYRSKKIVFLNETKSKADKASINEFEQFINNKTFYNFFPEYKDYTLIPIYSSIYINKELIELLTKKKILAVRIEGDILTFENFNELKEIFGVDNKKENK